MADTAAKVALLGVAIVAGTIAIGHAMTETRRMGRVKYDPLRTPYTPGPGQGALNVVFAHLGIYLGIAGMHELLVGSGYTQAEAASIIPTGVAAAGTIALVGVAAQVAKS